MSFITYVTCPPAPCKRTLAEVKEARKTAIERQKVEEKLRGQEQTKVIAKLRRQLQALRHKVLSLLAAGAAMSRNDVPLC